MNFVSKKILFILSLCGALFLGYFNVSAKDYITLDYDSPKLKNYLSENKNGLKSIKNYWENKMPYTDENGKTYNNYAIKFASYQTHGFSGYSNEIDVVLYNSDTIYLNSYYRSGYDNSVYFSDFGSYLAFSYKSNSAISLEDFKEKSTSVSEVHRFTYYGEVGYGNVTFPRNYFEDFFSPRWSENVPNFSYIYHTNSNFQYKQNTYGFNFKYNDEELKTGDELPLLSSINVSNINITFSINENKTNIDGTEYITSKDVTIDFGSIDNTKYMYRVSYNGGDTWETYTLTSSTSIIRRITKNSEIVAQIVNREDNSVVTTNNLTITGITSPVSVTLEDVTKTWPSDPEDSRYCFKEIDGKKYQVCSNIKMSFSVVDNNKYNYYYSNTGGSEFTKIEDLLNNDYYHQLYKSGNYIVKVTDKSGNLIDSASISITLLDQVQEVGQKILLSYQHIKDVTCPDLPEISYDNPCQHINIHAVFLNVDTNQYNYYYSVDSGPDLKNWILINDELQNTNKYIHVIYESTTFTAKVTDKHGTYITSAHININYEDVVGDNDDNPLKEVFKFVKDYIYKKLPIIEQLGNIYDSFQYIDGVDTPPIFEFNLGFMGAGKYTINFNFFDNYRQIFFNFIKIFFSIYTVLSIVDEVKKMVGGDS